MTGIRHERAEQQDGFDFGSQRRFGANPTEALATAGTVSPEKPKPTGGEICCLEQRAFVILAAALWFGIPWVQTTLNTVSTDDAYVNGHVTFVAARVKGQVSRVLVDDNYRVHRGDLLVQLDKEPFQIAVAVKKAAVDTATADLQVAKAKVRGIEAEAMSRRRALEHAIEDVDNQVALLHARIADVDKSKAELTLAQLDFDRAAKLVVTNDIPRESSTTGGKRTYWRRARTLSRRWPMSVKSAPLWDCRRNPTREISAKFRPISIKPFLPCSRRRRR